LYVTVKLGADLLVKMIVPQVSTSAIFYKQLFLIKVFCANFLYLQICFAIFGGGNIGTEAVRKMLVKLTPSPVIPILFSYQRRKQSKSV